MLSCYLPVQTFLESVIGHGGPGVPSNNIYLRGRRWRAQSYAVEHVFFFSFVSFFLCRFLVLLSLAILFCVLLLDFIFSCRFLFVFCYFALLFFLSQKPE